MKKPLDICEVEVSPPQKGEVRLRVIAAALCHTDTYGIDGDDSMGKFPTIPGHEATAVVESIGEGVTTLQVGNIVIPCFIEQCKEKDCIFCQNNNCNTCSKYKKTQD